MFMRCCIEGCNSRRQNVSLYSFPSNEKRLETWLECINCEYLRKLSLKDLRKHYVCENHFEKRFLASTAVRARIRVNAFPTLFSETEIRSGIPQRSYFPTKIDVQRITVEHSYHRKRQHEDHTYGKMPSEVETSLEIVTPSDSVEPLVEANIPSNSSCDMELMEPTTELIVEDTESIQPLKTKFLVKKKKVVFRKNYLSPGYSYHHKGFLKLKQLQCMKRARRKPKFSKQKLFDKMTKKMNPLAKKIIWMQIKQCSKAKGLKFSTEDKRIALSLLKQSPKHYRFLQKIFILPSEYSLKKMFDEMDTSF